MEFNMNYLNNDYTCLPKKSFWKLKFILLLLAVLITFFYFFWASAANVTLFVDTMDTNCSDSGPGTEQTPYCSIQSAANVSTSGDTVNVASGTYNERVILSTPGIQENPIVYNFNNAIISKGINIGSNYNIINNLHVTPGAISIPDSERNGMNHPYFAQIAVGGDNNIINGLELHDESWQANYTVTTGGLVFYGSNNRVNNINLHHAKGVYFSANNNGSNNSVVGGEIANTWGTNVVINANGSTLENIDIHDPGQVSSDGNASDGINLNANNVSLKNIRLYHIFKHFSNQHTDAIQWWNNANDLLIENSIIGSGETGGPLSLKDAGDILWETYPGTTSHRVKIRNNIFLDNGSQNIHTAGIDNTNQADNWEIYNNTFAGTIGNWMNGSNPILRNNIFIATQQLPVMGGALNPVADHNAIVQLTDFVNGGFDVARGYGRNADWNLVAGSDARGAGIRDTKTPLIDFAGQSRNNPPSLGAYEYNPGQTYVYDVEAIINPAGAGTVGGVGGIASGGNTNLIASPAALFHFDSWSGDCSGNTNPYLIINLNNNVTCIANFVADSTVNLEITVSPTSGGRVKGAGIYSLNQTTALGAYPYAGYSFTGWSGDCSSNSPEITYLVNGNKNCTANFLSTATYTVSGTASPPEGGSISGSSTVHAFESATLTASPNNGYRFVSWLGDCSGASNVYTLTNITSNKSCVATFSIDTYTVNFNSSGGSPVESLTEISHGSLISSPTAPSKNHYNFAGWYKEESLLNAWDFQSDTVTSAITLYAKWTPVSYLLTASVNPENSGSVNGGGIYSYNQSANLQATASEGYSFVFWSGDCLGTSSSFGILIDSNKSCVANFELSEESPIYDVTENDRTHSEAGVDFNFESLPQGVTGINLFVSSGIDFEHNKLNNRMLVRIFNIVATDQNNNPIIDGFIASLTFHYTDAKNSDLVFFWDSSDWKQEGLSKFLVNETENTVTFETNHLTSFGIFVNSKDDTYQLPIDNFQNPNLSKVLPVTGKDTLLIFALLGSLFVIVITSIKKYR